MPYQILDVPWVYDLAQMVLGTGGASTIVRKLEQLTGSIAPGDRLLDVGCGPASWLWRVKLDPLGVDFSPSYIQKYCARGRLGIVGAAEALPFRSRYFQSIWSVGLLHHLSDDAAHQAVVEMARVCCSNGWVVILDAVMPASAWRRPLAYTIRRLDRGGFVRSESDLKAIIRAVAGNEVIEERVTYSLYGLELLVIRFQPPSNRPGNRY